MIKKQICRVAVARRSQELCRTVAFQEQFGDLRKFQQKSDDIGIKASY